MDKKIFVIGMNKCGTTSLFKLFKDSGLRAIHTTENVLKIANKYDAFSDGRHNEFFRYYEAYPDSVFILNTRNLKNWLVSRYKHAKRKNFQNNNYWCWPPSLERTQQWADSRNLHHKKVLEFFSNKPDKLIIVDIEKSGWEEFVFEFISSRFQGLTLKKLQYKANQASRKSIPKEKMKKIRSVVAEFFLSSDYVETEKLFTGASIENYDFKTNLQ